MATERGKVVTYHKTLLSITTYDLVITWTGSHGKLKKIYLTTTMSLDIKLGKVGVCNAEHLLIKLYGV